LIYGSKGAKGAGVSAPINITREFRHKLSGTLPVETHVHEVDIVFIALEATVA